MPAVRVDLEPHKGTIKQWLSEDVTLPRICILLREIHDLKVSRSTLCSRLSAWGICRQTPLKEQLARVKEVIKTEHARNRSDLDIRQMLARPEAGGLELSQKKFNELRRKTGIVRRRTAQQRAANRIELCKLIRAVLDEGHTENLGYRMLTVLLRGRGCDASR